MKKLLIIAALAVSISTHANYDQDFANSCMELKYSIIEAFDILSVMEETGVYIDPKYIELILGYSYAYTVECSSVTGPLFPEEEE